MCISILSIPTWTWMAIHVRFQSLGEKKLSPHDSPETPQSPSKNGWHKGGPLVYLECKEQSHVAFVDSFMKHIKMKTRSFLLLPFFVGGSWFRSLVVKHWSEDGDHPFPISNRIASPVTWPKPPSSWGFEEVPNLNQPWFQVAEIYHTWQAIPVNEPLCGRWGWDIGAGYHQWLCWCLFLWLWWYQCTSRHLGKSTCGAKTLGAVFENWGFFNECFAYEKWETTCSTEEILNFSKIDSCWSFN